MTATNFDSLLSGARSVELPIDDASSLPRGAYTDSSWYAAELESVFSGTWLFACHESELKTGGNVLSTTIRELPIIIVRTRNGEINAFLNSCRHRGCSLVDENVKARALVCPFHGWTYDLDGYLRSAPGMEGARNFSMNSTRLKTVSCASRGGFVFVRFGDGPEIDEYLGSFRNVILDAYGTKNLDVVHRRSYSLKTNWKLYVEVDQETLHTDFVHPSSIGTQTVSIPRTSKNWVTVIHDSESSPALAPGDEHFSLPPHPWLSPSLHSRTYFSVLLPGFFLITAPDVMWWINKSPISPSESRVSVGYAFAPEAMSSASFEDSYSRYRDRLDQVIREDDWITERQYEGIGGYIPGPFSTREAGVQNVDRWIMARLSE